MSPRLKFAVVAILAAALCWLVEHNVDWIAGPWYWRWAWRRIDPIRVVPPMLLAASPIFIAQWLHGRRIRNASENKGRLTAAVLLLLITTSLLLMMLVSAGVQKWPFHLKRITEVVKAPQTTSYYTDAAAWMSDAQGPSLTTLLAQYPQRLAAMHLHARLRPPGPLLLHALMIRMFGATDRAAMMAGVILLALGSLSAPATYLLARQLAPDRPDAAFHAASFIALTPALVWFSPTLDQVLPLFTVALIGLWCAALRTGSILRTIGFALALAAALFVTFNVLVLGVFLVGMTVLMARRDRPGPARAARCVLVAATCIAAIYLILWLITGYNAPATLTSALSEQAKLTREFFPPRPYPITVPFDVLDFLLGAGWLAAALLFFYAVNRDARPTEWWPRWAVRLALLQIFAVAISGTLAAETARVWIFLQPLLALVVGRELSTWDRASRLGFYAAQFTVMVTVGANMWLLAE